MILHIDCPSCRYRFPMLREETGERVCCPACGNDVALDHSGAPKVVSAGSEPAPRHKPLRDELQEVVQGSQCAFKAGAPVLPNELARCGCSRITYAILAISIVGPSGAHNFYSGQTRRGLVKLAMVYVPFILWMVVVHSASGRLEYRYGGALRTFTVLGSIASWLWAWIEAVFEKRDG